MLNFFIQFLTPAQIKYNIHYSYSVIKKTVGFSPDS